jgi:hypothetical protein
MYRVAVVIRVDFDVPLRLHASVETANVSREVEDRKVRRESL